MDKFRFSVFTATFNRVDLLPRLYKSLVSQCYKDFEWIVVDDGSTDGTKELISRYKALGELKEIIYIEKENGGKHTAWKIAENLFRGSYVVAIDSDDCLTPNALQFFNERWLDLENSKDYDNYWEVKGRVQDENSVMVGTILPSNMMTSSTLEIAYKYRIHGEMLGCRKPEVLRAEARIPEEFLFSDLCSNLDEIVRWSRAGKKYKTLYTNEVVRTYFFDATDSLSTISTRKDGNLRRSYNTLVSAFYQLKENRREMILWNKSVYFKNLLVFIYVCFRLRLNAFKLVRNEFNGYDKLWMVLLFFPVYFFYLIREKLV